MTSPIERLPVEVFDIILLELDLDRYQQLRLTSRQLHSLSLSPFAKKYFSKITTTLGSPSLNRLANVSTHAYFCHVVTQLNVKLLTYRDYKTLMAIRRVGIFPPPKRFPAVRGVRPTDIQDESTLFDDLKDSKHAKCITDRLARSLAQLDNLKAICFRAMHSEPVGWGFINMPSKDQIFRHSCFHIVVEAIIQSGSKLEEFNMAKSTRLKPGKVTRGVDLESPAFQLHGSAASSLSQAFSHLQTLTLSLTSNRNNSTYATSDAIYPSQFIACAPSLKHLTLKLDRGSYRSNDSSIVFHHIAKFCRLPALESFNLVNCALHVTDLEQYLDAHAHSLCAISLTSVHALSGTWAAIWQALKKVERLESLIAARLDSPEFPRYIGKKYPPKKKLDVRRSEQRMGDMLEELIVSCYGDRSPSQGPAGMVSMWA